MTEIPVIDLSLSEKEVLPQLHNACEGLGFFYLVNHGIDLSEMEKAVEETKRFFALPMKVKETISSDMDVQYRGYTPFKKDIQHDKSRQTIADIREQFLFGRPPEEDETRNQLIGPNQWLPDEQIPGYRAFMENYRDQLTNVALKVVDLLGKCVGLFSNDSSEDSAFNFMPLFEKPGTFLRVQHYKPVEHVEPGCFYGILPHTDLGMLTLLQTDGVPGLQIYPFRTLDPETVDPNDEHWTDIPHKPGSFIVNLGDLLQRWTNDRYKSTLHRVVTTQERYSLPFFFDPNVNCLIECIPSCLAPGEEPKHPPITCHKHITGTLDANR